MTKNYKPASTIEHRVIEKDLYKLFSGTDFLVLQVLDPPSDASEDEAEAEIPSLSDAVSSCSLSEGKSLGSYLQTVYSGEIISKIEEITRGQSDNNTWLKESSSWHTQIQGKMGICKKQWCDFVFYTKKGIAVDRIIFDKNQYKDIIVKCEQFFHKYVVQAIQSD
ncbi:uncharacterized protein LOC127706583 [Mytilus californianus]|uniref:uncharacterized protein LOC127706583 n=1 Tax=Mytilus californianus TaxID=6549 RepID=UPI0022458DA3|nr:uncharacterized protein LOC127706583 [Mytilus californianus]